MKTSVKASQMPAKEKKKKKDLAASYNRFKHLGGQFYTGAKVGRHQKWYYDRGEWKEQKITPDRWQFTYAVTKRRAGKAPEGSGAYIGTEYHWYILAHQIVRKVNANDYPTEMTGTKFKVAHKRYDKEKWSASDQAQRKRLIKILRDYADELESESLETREKIIKPTTARSKTSARCVRQSPVQRAPRLPSPHHA